jgi:sulfite reductase (NADPH) hemoprotein beta-component
MIKKVTTTASVAKLEVANTLAALLDVYVSIREEDETFLQVVRRVGVTPFRERVYAPNR